MFRVEGQHFPVRTRRPIQDVGMQKPLLLRLEGEPAMASWGKIALPYPKICHLKFVQPKRLKLAKNTRGINWRLQAAAVKHHLRCLYFERFYKFDKLATIVWDINHLGFQQCMRFLQTLYIPFALGLVTATWSTHVSMNHWAFDCDETRVAKKVLLLTVGGNCIVCWLLISFLTTKNLFFVMYWPSLKDSHFCADAGFVGITGNTWR